MRELDSVATVNALAGKLFRKDQQSRDGRQLHLKNRVVHFK